MKPFTTCVAIILLLVVFSIYTGCTRRTLDFTIISSKNTDMKVNATGKGQRVVGKDGVYWFLFIPLGTPHLKEAVDRAIESAGPEYDALIDGVIYSTSYWYILSGYTGFKIVGTPIKSSELEAELRERGENVSLAMERVLFHSSRGISNKKAIEKIGIVQVKNAEDLELMPSGESTSR